MKEWAKATNQPINPTDPLTTHQPINPTNPPTTHQPIKPTNPPTTHQPNNQPTQPTNQPSNQPFLKLFSMMFLPPPLKKTVLHSSPFPQGLELKIFHFASAINACAKSNAPDRDEVALRLFNDSRVEQTDWNCKLGGGFKYFLFSTLLGEMIQFD